MPETSTKLETEIAYAQRLHGHLGPFLVVGVRIGLAAERFFRSTLRENMKATAHIKVPLQTPFSCTLDGIQSATGCTVGNQRLKIENSPKDITIFFEIEGIKKKIKFTIQQKTITKFLEKSDEESHVEALALEAAQMHEADLYETEVVE